MISIFDKLNEDVILYILEFLNDYDKIRFTSIETQMNSLKYHIKFYNEYEYNKIKHLSFIKNFKQITYLSHDTNIPNNVTHLTFGDRFNQEIKDVIPNSVTHLTFGWKFNREIKDCIFRSRDFASLSGSTTISSNGYKGTATQVAERSEIAKAIDSVTHLTFGTNFNQKIKDCIPPSVIYLTFMNQFPKFNKNHIPSTVKYLKFLNN